MSDSTDKLLPVTLPSWPNCDHCISWSQDDLAVSGGECVYILTPKSFSSGSATAGHPQWNILNVRVNLFRQDEWPDQITASIKDFSIGEEQSNSHVVALSWSSPGLGIHKRSVLGVLTSNSILSLWETNGSHAQYQRMCIVNNCRALRLVSEKDISGRRAKRVRSFVWVPPLRNAFTNRWGLQCIAISNDNGSLVFLHITEQESNKSGSKKWNFEVGLELSLDDFDSSKTDVASMSPLQRRLYQQTPITKIDITPWSQIEPSHNGDDADSAKAKPHPDMYFANVTITRGNATYTTRICAAIQPNGRQVSFYHRDTSDGGATDVSPEREHKEYSIMDGADEPTIMNTPSQDFFREAIQPVSNDFDNRYQLFGHTRTRFWGSTVSADGSKAVACITLHPADMIEYMIPSAEKSTLVFKNTGRMPVSAATASKSTKHVQEDILRFARDALSGHSVGSLFDKKLYRAYVNLAGVILDPVSELRMALESLHVDISSVGAADQDSQMIATEVNGQPSTHYALGSEACEICGSDIAFTTDLSGGTCSSGHQFSRCQISFLGLQEPGISKYCSECSKQFLDLAKLGPVQGPSFAQKVFDEFDVCPYCQGKFRG